MEYLTVKEIAEALKVHVITVQRWLRTGKLKGKQLNKIWYVEKEYFKEFMKGE